jgi:DMATS type aromatic prenyltransferase
MTVKSTKVDRLPQSYVSLTKALDFPNHDQELWWTKSAPLLARIMESANYSVHQQYQFLTLYNTLLVPHLGPFQDTWHCSITHSGIGVEFSVNYQEHGVRTVRIGYEPVSYISGTARDQYNIITADNAMNRFARLQLPSFDTRLYTGFMKHLSLDIDEAKILKGAKLHSSKFKTQAAFGLDLKGEDVAVKSYVYPALKAHITGKTFRQLLDKAVQGQEDAVQYADAVTLVSDYMTAGNCYNQYSFIGFDCKTPSSSRLKVYGAILDISWAKVAEIWTLGGRLADHKGNQTGLDLLEKLWGCLTPHKVSRSVLDFILQSY